MTLDTAVECFKAMPNPDIMLKYLEVATDYWTNATIADETFADHLSKIADWLREDR